MNCSKEIIVVCVTVAVLIGIAIWNAMVENRKRFREACTQQADCAPGLTCKQTNGTKVCLKSEGRPCASADDCASGACAAGICAPAIAGTDVAGVPAAKVGNAGGVVVVAANANVARRLAGAPCTADADCLDGRCGHMQGYDGKICLPAGRLVYGELADVRRID